LAFSSRSSYINRKAHGGKAGNGLADLHLGGESFQQRAAISHQLGLRADLGGLQELGDKKMQRGLSSCFSFGRLIPHTARGN